MADRQHGIEINDNKLVGIQKPRVNNRVVVGSFSTPTSPSLWEFGVLKLYYAYNEGCYIDF